MSNFLWLTLSLVLVLGRLINLLINKSSLDHIIDFSFFNLIIFLIMRLINWFMVFGCWIPVNILFLLSWIRFFQAVNLENHDLYKTKQKDENGLETGRIIPTIVNNSNLNEELGQINMVFCDKTGTITQNSLLMDQLIVGSTIYSKTNLNESSKLFKSIEKVDKQMMEVLSRGGEEGDELRKALRCMALCHSSFYDEKNTMNYSSQEEKLMIRFARKYQFIYKKPMTLMKKSKEEILVIKEFEKKRKFKLLVRLPFTSSRKKCSIIFIAKNKLLMFTIGAWDTMIEKISEWPDKDENLKLVKGAANRGHKVMILSWKTLTAEEYDDWHAHYLQYGNTLKEDVHDIESNLSFIGAVCLKDQLQEGVKESFSLLRKSQLKIFIISGDDFHSVLQCSQAIELINDSTKIEYVDSSSQADHLSLLEIEKKLDKKEDIALVISGDIFTIISKNDQDLNSLLKVLQKCKKVLAYRFDSEQKGKLTRLLRRSNKRNVILAIGDGLNDMNMMASSNISIGIMSNNKNGFEITQVSDFTVGSFEKIIPLILVFGHRSLRRQSQVILQSFYQGILPILSILWISLFNGFSLSFSYNHLIFYFYYNLMTFIPLLLFGIREKQNPKKALANLPQLYTNKINNSHFSFYALFTTFLTAFFMSGNLSLISVGFFSYSNFDNGYFYGYFDMGMVILFACLLLSSLHLLYLSQSYSLIYIMSFMIGPIILFTSWLIVSSMENTNLYDSIRLILSNQEFYFYSLTIFSISLIDYLFIKLENFYKEPKVSAMQTQSKDKNPYKNLENESMIHIPTNADFVMN